MPALVAGVAVCNVVQGFQEPLKALVKPVTITYKETVYAADGRILAEVHKFLAIRSDGTKVSATLPTSKNYTSREVRDVILPVLRKHMVVADAIKAASTFYLDAPSAESMRFVRVDATCDPRSGGTVSLAREELLLGYRTLVYRIEHPDGTVHTSWYAPDLDCHPLRGISGVRGPERELRVRFERSAMTVRVGEPDPSWFDVPPSYRELTPSAANRELWELGHGTPFPSQLTKGAARMDRQYFESQLTNRKSLNCGGSGDGQGTGVCCMVGEDQHVAHDNKRSACARSLQTNPARNPRRS